MARRYWGTRLLGAAVVVFLGQVAGCAELTDIETGRCGNRVLDPGEDCDTFGESEISCGAAQTERACRFVCDFAAGESAPGQTGCPSGYRCGLGDVCVRPSNEFELAERPLLTRTGNAFTTTDLDGDRLSDVAVLSSNDALLHVAFLQGTTVGVEQQIPVTASPTFAAGLVTPDGLPDLLVGSDAAVLSVGASQVGAGLSPTAFAQYDFASRSARAVAASSAATAFVAGSVERLEPDADVEGIILDFGGGQSSLFIVNPYTGGTPLVGELPGLETLRASLKTPVFARPLDRPVCDELVFGFDRTATQGARLAITQLCTLPDGEPINTSTTGCEDFAANEARCTQLVEFGSVTLGGAWAVEIDGDPGREIAVALGDSGARSLRIVQESGGLDLTSDVYVLPEIEQAAEVLWVGDFNGDAQLDFVTNAGAFVSRLDDAATQSYSRYRAAEPTEGRWSEIAVGDFDGDGRLDFAAARRSTSGAALPDLDLRFSSGSSYFNPAILATGKIPSLLTSADYDGDGYHDLVMRKRDPALPEFLPSCTTPDELLVSFGGPAGMSPSSVFARVAGVEAVIGGRLPRRDKRDGISDFGATSHCQLDVDANGDGQLDEDSFRVTVFYGATSRQLAAPYLLIDQQGDAAALAGVVLIPFLPQAIATAPDRRAAAVLANLGDDELIPQFETWGSSMFVLETPGELMFQQARLIPAFQHEVTRPTIATADFDGDGQLEVSAADGEEFVLIDRVECFPAATEVEASDPALLPCGIPTMALRQAAGRSVSGLDMTVVSQLAADLDADGVVDLLLSGQGPDGVARMTVLWGGANFLDAPERTDLAFAEGEHQVSSAALLPRYRTDGGDLSAAPAYDLVFLLQDQASARLLRQTFRGRQPETRDSLATFPAANQLSVADLDGDGFEDVAALTPNGVRAILRRPIRRGDNQ